MEMELDPAIKRRVWWKGAIIAAVKGIPQGLILGALGATLLYGVALLFPPSVLIVPFGSFMTVAGVFNPVPMMALNTVFTAVGNFMLGGNAACNSYKQDVEHRMNEARISRLEGHGLGQQTPYALSPKLQHIVDHGPRNRGSFADAETEHAASTPAQPTIH